jgi:hypothetical protein
MFSRWKQPLNKLPDKSSMAPGPKTTPTPRIPGLCQWPYSVIGYFSQPVSTGGQEIQLNVRAKNTTAVQLVDSDGDGNLDVTLPPVQIPAGSNVHKLCGGLFNTQKQELWNRYVGLLEAFQPPDPQVSVPRLVPPGMRVVLTESGVTEDGQQSFKVLFQNPLSTAALLEPLAPKTGSVEILGKIFPDGKVSLSIKDTGPSGFQYSAVTIKDSNLPTEVDYVKKLHALAATVKPS